MVEVVKNIPSKKTRWSYLIVMTVLVTSAWLLSFFGVVEGTSAITFDNWVEFVKWSYGLYAMSEVGAKASTAVMNKVN